MSSDPPALESLMFAWGDAYIFGYARDRWVAIRRDGLLFLPADTLTQLETEIESDYGNNPVLDECDALDAISSCLIADHGSQPECTDDLLARAVRAAEAITRRAAENHLILSQLRALFPDWDIEYCEQIRGWIARRKGATIWENSPLNIRLALTLIEQKQEHDGTGTQEGPQRPDGP
jgi:hypothetical protein